ncbi:MAG TPA: anhydro-N-acetylmuramic acid kinase [Candidatus Limnocylindria bacterium]|nr:anhydro-N-acetylmuramic acid kinase [Candidatus Limnocylindria bacterium]
MIAIGLMSGTSLDGVEAVLAEIGEGDPPAVRLLAHRHRDYDRELRALAMTAASAQPLAVEHLAVLHRDLADAYADAVADLLADSEARPELVAMHGQTVLHRVDLEATLQLGDAARVAIRTGLPVVADFRTADVAAGGQGAPLVPFADHVLFGERAPIALLNLGGIANLTLLPTRRADDAIAFDTGPANMVSDALVATAGERHDEGGARARRGRVREGALAKAMTHPFFARRAPKSCGREEFGAPFARSLLIACDGDVDDAVATAVALTARTIAGALARETPVGVSWRELVVAGGGARNPALVDAIREAVAPLAVRPIDDHGIPSEAREALAFAILGVYRWRGLPNTLPSCTGASRPVSGGAVHDP